MFASPSDLRPQAETAHLHPEFGYLAPPLRFRRKLMLTFKAGVLGALAGAVAMFFLNIDRDEKPLAMLATPVLVAPAVSKPTELAPVAQAAAPAASTVTLAVATPAAPIPAAPTRPATGPSQQRAAPGLTAPPPVRFVPETIALPEAAPGAIGLRGSTPSVAAAASAPVPPAGSTVGASAGASAMASAAPAPPPVAKAAARPKKKRIVREPPRHERTARLAAPEPEPPSRRFGAPIFGW